MVPKSDCFAAGDADVDAAAAGAVVPSVVEAAAAPSTTTAGAATAAPSGDAGTIGGVALSALLLSVSAAVTTGFVGADPFANDGLNAVTIDADRQHKHSMAKNRQVQFGIIRVFLVDAIIVFFVKVNEEFLIFELTFLSVQVVVLKLCR